MPCTLRPLQFHLPVLRCASNPQPQLSASHAGSHTQPTQLNKHVAPAAKGSAAPPACIATSTAHLSTLALPAQCRPKRTTANEDALRQRPAVPLEIVLQKLACRVGGIQGKCTGLRQKEEKRGGAGRVGQATARPCMQCAALGFHCGSKRAPTQGCSAGDVHSCTRLAFGDPQARALCQHSSKDVGAVHRGIQRRHACSTNGGRQACMPQREEAWPSSKRWSVACCSHSDHASSQSHTQAITKAQGILPAQGGTATHRQRSRRQMQSWRGRLRY